MKRKRIAIIIGMTLSLALVLSACGTKSKGDNTGNKAADSVNVKDEPEKVFGSFESKTLDGEEVSQEIFAEADLTMVNIWGTFCGPCIREMPELGELSREYAEKGVQVVGIVSDVEEPGDEKAEEIIDTTNADYTNIVAAGELKTGILSKINVVPTTIFVDKEGNQVGDVYSGARDKDAWAEIIEELLSEV